MLKKDLVRIKSSPIPRGHQHEEQVWEVKESLRKKQRRERNNDHSLGPPGRSRAGSRRASLRSPGGGGGNIAEVGLEILTHEYFRNKM